MAGRGPMAILNFKIDKILLRGVGSTQNNGGRGYLNYQGQWECYLFGSEAAELANTADKGGCKKVGLVLEGIDSCANYRQFLENILKWFRFEPFYCKRAFKCFNLKCNLTQHFRLCFLHCHFELKCLILK